VAGEDEAGIYAALGLQYIPPELREDRGEIEAARAGRLPRLIELADLRGDLHTHTDWTDGSAPLERMARAAQAAGLSYIAVTDHTKSLSVARGLDERRVREQRQLVERLNAELAPFRIFLGTEMDIRPDGALDLPDEVLAELDYVSVSVHSAMHQPREVMTARVIRAISNPFVHALNHPRGRLLRRREEYALDLEAVIEAAARHGVALELNAQPSRLDLDGEWAARAREAGCRFTISSDAHGPGQFALLRFGVGQARRGWLEARHVLNALSADELAAYLAEKRARARVRT
jgi:DNA polymerase (family 10)